MIEIRKEQPEDIPIILIVNAQAFDQSLKIKPLGGQRQTIQHGEIL
jgi:hypothetical protein